MPRQRAPVPVYTAAHIDGWMLSLARAIAHKCPCTVPHVALMRGRYVGDTTAQVTPESLLEGVTIRVQVPYQPNMRRFAEQTAVFKMFVERIADDVREGTGPIPAAMRQAGLKVCRFEVIDSGKNNKRNGPSNKNPQLLAKNVFA